MPKKARIVRKKSGSSKKKRSTFAKYRGIGTPGIEPTREGINRWIREMRGE